MIILVVFTGVLLLLLTFVIPKIASVFLKLRVSLPLPTRIMIFMSDIIIHYTIPAILVTAVCIVLLIFLYKKQKRIFVQLILGLPYVSIMARQIDLTRFCRSMYLLLTSAIPPVHSASINRDGGYKIGNYCSNSPSARLCGCR